MAVTIAVSAGNWRKCSTEAVNSVLAFGNAPSYPLAAGPSDLPDSFVLRRRAQLIQAFPCSTRESRVVHPFNLPSNGGGHEGTVR